MYEAKTCESCGRVLNENDGVWFDDTLYCSDCLEENTVICSHCGDRIWSRDNVGSDDTPLCRTCYDRHFTTCERCGAIIRENEAYYEGEDDDTPYCYDCHQRRRRERPIHDYYYKPEPIFHGDGLRYFGVELEIDGAGECNDAARQILRAADSEDEEYLYIKHDGSLDDDMELVTHPMTLDLDNIVRGLTKSPGVVTLHKTANAFNMTLFEFLEFSELNDYFFDEDGE